VFRSGSTAGISWLSVRRWLKKHPEVGELAGTSWPATLESIMAWIRARRELYEELDAEQRKEFETAARVKNTRLE
jgi:hypothetical protein